MTDATSPPSYTPPLTRESNISFSGSKYRMAASWTLLRKREKPVAEMFSVSYLAQGKNRQRPLTFVFNGGPGAASAFLHVGSLGPYRVQFGDKGTLPSGPVKLCDNRESWLSFTDLVFIDPIGTGFSRVIEDSDTGSKNNEGNSAQKQDPNEFFQMQRDLDSLGEFMERFLSQHKRWSSPIYIAGESYGGFRVARLSRRLQERFGIGLKGCFLISPAMELSVLQFTDYNLTPYINVFPALAATACIHKRLSSSPKSLEDVCRRAERFAVEKLPRALLDGASLPAKLSREYSQEMSELCGIPAEKLVSRLFRLPPYYFQRELLRDSHRFCGIYDGALTSHDPFPDREHFEGPDPTFQGVDRVFTSGVNVVLRERLGVVTDRSYHLLSEEAYTNWKVDVPRSFMSTELGSSDDLRYGLSLNDEMRVFVAHGCFDLITPYFSSKRILDSLALTPQQRNRISFESYLGGHMFYSWDESRKRFTEAAGRLYR